MPFSGATTPALSAALGEITAKATSSARPSYVESKGSNGTEPHAAVGGADTVAGPPWGHSAPGMARNGTESAAPGVTAASALPRVASTYTGIVDDMAPGATPDGASARYANRDRPDGQVLTGPTHDLVAQSTDNAGHAQLAEAEYMTRRQEQFPNVRKGFGQVGTSPAADPVGVRIGQVAPDARPANGTNGGSLNASTLGSIWRASGSAYNPAPAPPDAVVVDGNGQGGMRSWG